MTMLQLSLATRLERLRAIMVVLDAQGSWSAEFSDQEQNVLAVLPFVAPSGVVSTASDTAKLEFSSAAAASVVRSGEVSLVRFLDGNADEVLRCDVSPLTGDAPVRVSNTTVYAGGELSMISCIFAE